MILAGSDHFLAGKSTILPGLGFLPTILKPYTMNLLSPRALIKKTIRLKQYRILLTKGQIL
jgi:hypothetical protein